MAPETVVSNKRTKLRREQTMTIYANISGYIYSSKTIVLTRPAQKTKTTCSKTKNFLSVKLVIQTVKSKRQWRIQDCQRKGDRSWRTRCRGLQGGDPPAEPSGRPGWSQGEAPLKLRSFCLFSYKRGAKKFK